MLDNAYKARDLSVVSSTKNDMCLMEHSSTGARFIARARKTRECGGEQDCLVLDLEICVEKQSLHSLPAIIQLQGETTFQFALIRRITKRSAMKRAHNHVRQFSNVKKMRKAIVDLIHLDEDQVASPSRENRTHTDTDNHGKGSTLPEACNAETDDHVKGSSLAGTCIVLDDASHSIRDVTVVKAETDAPTTPTKRTSESLCEPTYEPPTCSFQDIDAKARMRQVIIEDAVFLSLLDNPAYRNKKLHIVWSDLVQAYFERTGVSVDKRKLQTRWRTLRTTVKLDEKWAAISALDALCMDV